MCCCPAGAFFCCQILKRQRRYVCVCLGGEKKRILPINARHAPELDTRGERLKCLDPSFSSRVPIVSGFLDGDQAGWVRDEVVEVLHLLRPMAVSLVDAW